MDSTKRNPRETSAIGYDEVMISLYCGSARYAPVAPPVKPGLAAGRDLW